MKIDDLLHERVFPHPVEALQMLETHSAWVILTGQYAYKIKKQVNFGFLDFSTLERRHRFCLEELRLNRRLAPELYLDVLPITHTVDGYAIGGSGTVADWTVKMRQFPQHALLSQRLQTEGISPEQIDQLATQIATFHASAERAAEETDFGSPQQATSAAMNNFAVFADDTLPEELRSQTQALKVETERIALELRPVFEQRKRDGFVRECHGDLHLTNIFLNHGSLTIFDGIEFNPSLRWIDVMSDLAFCLMDLEQADQKQLAHRLLNRYLEQTGDYAGLAVLRFYQAYRAMVRAKVCQLRLQQEAEENHEDPELNASLWRYLQLTASYQQRPPAQLFLMHGLSGSGKSHVSEYLLEQSGAIRIRSDVERKRLFVEEANPPSQDSLYTAEKTQSTYDHLLDLARQSLAADYSTIVDATFLASAERSRFIKLAQSTRVPVQILDCRASLDVLEQRVIARSQNGGDPSDADVQVLHQQLQTQQPFSAAERPFVCPIETSQEGWQEQVKRLCELPSD